MATKRSTRLLSVLLLSAALGATSAVAMDTGRRTPKPPPPDIVNCGNPGTSSQCFECETGGQWACCRDPNNCVVIDATSGAAFYYDDASDEDYGSVPTQTWSSGAAGRLYRR